MGGEGFEYAWEGPLNGVNCYFQYPHVLKDWVFGEHVQVGKCEGEMGWAIHLGAHCDVLVFKEARRMEIFCM